MSKSVKYKDNIYIDSTGVVHKKDLLSNWLDDLSSNKANKYATRLDNVDANTLKTQGTYYLGTGNSNVPTNWLILIVTGPKDVSQIGHSILTNYIYTRTWTGSAWTGWEACAKYPTTLYDSSGTQSNITLSETAANFSYLEIFYYIGGHGSGIYPAKSVKIENPNGRVAILDMVMPISAESKVYVDSTEIHISGTSVTFGDSYGWCVRSGGGYAIGGATQFYIKKIVGYR